MKHENNSKVGQVLLVAALILGMSSGIASEASGAKNSSNKAPSNPSDRHRSGNESNTVEPPNDSPICWFIKCGDDGPAIISALGKKKSKS